MTGRLHIAFVLAAALPSCSVDAEQPQAAQTRDAHGGDGTVREAAVPDARHDGPEAGADASPDGAPSGVCPDYDPLRRVFFGELHLHTSYSFDAYANFGTRVGPGEAYAFAKGSPVAVNGVDFRLERPLDFAAVTDHAEYFGDVPENEFITSLPNVEAWERTQAAAKEAMNPCTFTTFIAYEWSASPRVTGPLGVTWSHRNVIFASERVLPVAISANEAATPDALWEGLRSGCLSSGECDVITIPHNTNYSQGFSLEVEPSITASEANARAAIEPLIEVYQSKGASECKNGLDMETPDPMCDFEQLTPPLCNASDSSDCIVPCTEDAQSGHCEAPLGFVRPALKRGLKFEANGSGNPLQLGIIAATDTHNGTPGAVDEAEYMGHIGVRDGDPISRLVSADARFGSGGLAAVWAEENTRPSLFAALKRRETYGTSGPRIQVRVFGAWNLPDDMCRREDFVPVGYSRGVPMGGELRPTPNDTRGPSFFVFAMKHQGTLAHPGTPLQYIDVVKGWVDETGAVKEKVSVVAGDPMNAATVDTSTCRQSMPGEATSELCTIWRDTEFDPQRPTFYYFRVFENPSCRHSAYDCMTLRKLDAAPAACSDGSVPLSQQERAWTSPIWYRP